MGNGNDGAQITEQPNSVEIIYNPKGEPWSFKVKAYDKTTFEARKEAWDEYVDLRRRFETEALEKETARAKTQAA